jgi:hypothetical protein
VDEMEYDEFMEFHRNISYEEDEETESEWESEESDEMSQSGDEEGPERSDVTVLENLPDEKVEDYNNISVTEV